MYLALYVYLTFLFTANLKYKKINQDSLSFFTSIFFLIFFLFNHISADHEYYSVIYNKDIFASKREQGYDYLFYELSSFIALIDYPKIMQLIIYTSLLTVIYFFSKKFHLQFLIILLFYPLIFLVTMQAFPRQALALVFFLISIIIIFKLKKLNQHNFNYNNLILFFIFFFLIISTLFHYSAFGMMISFFIFYFLFFVNKSNFILIFLIALFGLIIFYLFNFDDIYFIKLNQLSDFYNSRENYSVNGFFIRSLPIFISSLIIIFFNIFNFFNKKLKIKYIDNFFFTLSLIYFFATFIVLFFKFEFIVILDRFGIYFFVLFVYFIGRFQFIITNQKKFHNMIIFLSLLYSNLYLLLWTLYSPANVSGEFKYCLFFLKCS